MTPYHAIMFGTILLGAASFIFQASENERMLSKKPLPVKVPDSKFDINTY
tara:strand:+ start:1318 stop:1467 length:150 start_codon:yes stop_codon:yes gene_type:complete